MSDVERAFMRLLRKADNSEVTYSNLHRVRGHIYSLNVYEFLEY